jgi:hypothetical protein
VECTISVPFERFAKLKTIIKQRQRWKACMITAVTLNCNGSLTMGEKKDSLSSYVNSTKSRFSWICSDLMNRLLLKSRYHQQNAQRAI